MSRASIGSLELDLLAFKAHHHQAISNVCFELDALSLSFELGDLGCVSILISECYPRGESKIYLPRAEEEISTKGTLHDIFKTIQAAITTSVNIDMPDRDVDETGNSTGDDCSVEDGDEQDDEMIEEDEDYAYDDSDDDYSGLDNTTHELTPLEIDINLCRDSFGPDSVKNNVIIDICRVSLFLSTEWMSDTIAAAWKVGNTKPLELQLFFSNAHYLEASSAPRAKVIQGLPCEEQPGLASQLEGVLRQYLDTRWKAEQGSKESLPSHSSIVQRSQSAPNDDDDRPAKSEMSSASSPATQQLEAMGFSRAMAKHALDASAGDIVAAAELCLQQTPHKSSASHPEVSERTQAPDRTAWDQLLSTESSKERASIEALLQPGFISQVMKFMECRLRTLNCYCVICDQPPVFQGSMLKPCVCARELCAFSFNELGVMKGAADDIATDAEVIDLLICMTTIAANHARSATIFDPFPKLFEPGSAKPVISDRTNVNEMSRIRAVLKGFPSVQDMVNSSSAVELQKEFEQRDKLAFNLLNWIIASNRSHIVGIKPDKRIRSVGTPHQYLLITQSPEKESKFQTLKKKYGSKFAFHGSPPENWHAILRQGLRNLSGSTKQLHGAAHGQGIYLATNATTSMGYSNKMGHAQSLSKPKMERQTSGNRFLDASSLCMIALCEVVDHPNIKKSSYCWVCPDENTVCTRFFFVFNHWKGITSMNSLRSDSQSFVDEVKQCLEQNGM